MIGTDAERAGTIRRGARALYAVHQATVPWVSILVRKVFGVAGAGHGDGSRLNLRYAWPSGDWGSLPIAGGIEAAYRRELEAADDPVALRAEIEARLDAVRSPFRTAERFCVEEIIDPRDTRPILCDWAARAHELVRTSFPRARRRAGRGRTTRVGRRPPLARPPGRADQAVERRSRTPTSRAALRSRPAADPKPVNGSAASKLRVQPRPPSPPPWFAPRTDPVSGAPPHPWPRALPARYRAAGRSSAGAGGGPRLRSRPCRPPCDALRADRRAPGMSRATAA